MLGHRLLNSLTRKTKRHHLDMASTEKFLATRRGRMWKLPGHRHYAREKKFLEQKWNIWFGDWTDDRAREISGLGVSLPTVYRWKKQFERDQSWRPWKTRRGRDRRIFTDAEEGAISEFITENWLVPGHIFNDQDFQRVVQDAYAMKYLQDDEFMESGANIRDFHASAGFISDFKKRNGFATRRAHAKKRPARNERLENAFVERVQKLLRDPEIDNNRIINVDETFWRCVPTDLKTRGRKGHEEVPLQVNASEKDGLTVVAAVSASRCKLPLSIIAAGETTRCEQALGDTYHHHKTHSSSGWSTITTFSEYLMFIREYFGDDDRIWLLLDAYSVHRTDEVKKLADSMNIELIFIPPGQTERFQPLDRAVFGVLKAYLRKLWRVEYSENPSLRFDKTIAVKLLIPAWERISPRVIDRGWAIFSE